MEQKERGALVIISCHDTDLLINLSDEIFGLENGIVKEHIVSEEKLLIQILIYRLLRCMRRDSRCNMKMTL